MTTVVRRARSLVAPVLLTLVGTACGGGGGQEATEGTAPAGVRTVRIEMRDVAFSPDRVGVRPGETVRFVFRNVGKIRHEAFIGDEAAQEAHEVEMRERRSQGTSMTMAHAGDEGGITVEPGETGELTHAFKAGDQLLIGCHEPGHYEAGMKVVIEVG